MRRPVALVVAVLALVAAGCSGIPRDSRPSTIQSIGAEEPAGGQVPPPVPGDSARNIVEGFLAANGTSDPTHDGAFQFLTSQSHWDPTNVIVVNNEHVDDADPTTDNVEVTGTEVGRIDRTGVYTPALSGDGSGNGGGQPVTATYGLVVVRGQWRINKVQPNGVLLTAAQFDAYRQHAIYFFDSAERRLIPDPRWSAPLDPPALAQFLMAQLALGPRDNLQADETTETPPQSDPTHVLVTTIDSGPDGGLTKIEVPQSSQSSKATLNLLAAQIAHTLVPQVSGIDEMEITDGGVPVSIPSVHGPIFTADEVTPPYLALPTTPALYYVGESGGILEDSGTALPGRIGSGAYGFESAALTDGPAGKGLLVVATRRDHGGQALDIGSVDNNGQMIAVKLPLGPLSRPDWVPGGSEAWIGDGSRLYRVLPNGKASQINLTEPSGIANARISAVRLSPEGARVALVLTNAAGSALIAIGAVVRSGGQVRVDSLTSISPQGVDIVDVAWNDELKLFAVGHEASNGPASVYEVQVDGSLWKADGIANLPLPPDSITASQGFVASVSSGDTIWRQSGAAWIGLKGPGEDAKGTAPIYSN